MNNYILIIIVVILLALFYVFKDKISALLAEPEKKLPYEKKEFLLNIPERKFYEELQKIIPENYIIFPQVLISSILDVIAKGREKVFYRNKIQQKTIDFVIFKKPYLTPILAIEYDGKTHREENRKLRDEFVNKALDSAGIKCMHILHKKDINFIEIENDIKRILN